MHITGDERGYLHEKFRLFHSRDQKELKVDWHYHTFDKIVFFITGHVDYTVESETYPLRPGDLLTIAQGQLHRMHAYDGAAYERVILYLDHAYLSSIASEAGGLGACFRHAREKGVSLLRLHEPDRAAVSHLLQKLEKALTQPSPYQSTLSEAILTEFMVLLCLSAEKNASERHDTYGDDKVTQAIAYIQTHLSENLSCDTLAAHLFMSRSSFQHRFRAATGYPPHAYIRLKRLLHAAELLTEGVGAVQAGKLCGYTDHSAFCHAFTQQYGMPPSQFHPSRSLDASAKLDE